MRVRTQPNTEKKKFKAWAYSKFERVHRNGGYKHIEHEIIAFVHDRALWTASPAY